MRCFNEFCCEFQMIRARGYGCLGKLHIKCAVACKDNKETHFITCNFARKKTCEHTFNEEKIQSRERKTTNIHTRQSTFAN